MNRPAIEIQRLQFGWPRHPPLLDIEQLRVLRGERLFLKGASGSGKSTLLGLIGGVLRPQRGAVHVMGTELGSLSDGERDRFRGDHIGFIFQMFNLVPYLTVRANVLLPLQFSPMRRARLAQVDTEGEALRLLGALGLSEPALLDRPVTQLSIGQQQRVAAARALLGRPDILIADEPTSSLDADARTDFLQLLLQECSESGATLVFVSHDASLASRFDRTLAMNDINLAANLAGSPV